MVRDEWLWFDDIHGYTNNVIVKDIKSALIECYNHAHCSVCVHFIVSNQH